MGIVAEIFAVIFGGGRNVLRETAEVFVENTEAGAQRAQTLRGLAMQQFGAEFAMPKQGRFDRFMDGLNRLPRPALALGTLALFVSAMVDPVWFTTRMQGIVLVPEPLWWLLGVIVSFYFGARHQRKAQDFQRDIAVTMARVPQVVANVAGLDALGADNPGGAGTDADVLPDEPVESAEHNAALEDWRAQRAL